MINLFIEFSLYLQSDPPLVEPAGPIYLVILDLISFIALNSVILVSRTQIENLSTPIRGDCCVRFSI